MRCFDYAQHDKNAFIGKRCWDFSTSVEMTLIMRFTICDFSYARLKSSNKLGFNSLNWKILHFGRNDTNIRYEMSRLCSTWHVMRWLVRDASTLTLAPLGVDRWFAQHDKNALVSKRCWDFSTSVEMTLIMRFTICDFSYARCKALKKFLCLTRAITLWDFSYRRNDTNIRYEMSRLCSTWQKCGF